MPPFVSSHFNTSDFNTGQQQQNNFAPSLQNATQPAASHAAQPTSYSIALLPAIIPTHLPLQSYQPSAQFTHQPTQAFQFTGDQNFNAPTNAAYFGAELPMLNATDWHYNTNYNEAGFASAEFAPQSNALYAPDNSLTHAPASALLDTSDAQNKAIEDILSFTSASGPEHYADIALLAGMNSGQTITVEHVQNYLAHRQTANLDTGEGHFKLLDTPVDFVRAPTTPELSPVQNTSLLHVETVEPAQPSSSAVPEKAAKKQRTNPPKPRQKVDPHTGVPSDKPDAIWRTEFNLTHRFDPVTGEVSTAPNSVAHNTYIYGLARKKQRDLGEDKVDLKSGQTSTADNAVSSSAYYKRRLVDPVSGNVSTEPNAIPRRQFLDNRLVDPLNGKPSGAPDAIPYKQYSRKRLVDPVTGANSSESNAITAERYAKNRLVDPETGKSSSEPDAIPYHAFRGKQLVDPVTGKPSAELDAISYNRFHQQKPVDRITGKSTDAADAISANAFRKNKQALKRNAFALEPTDVPQPSNNNGKTVLLTAQNQPFNASSVFSFRAGGAFLPSEQKRS